MRHRRWTAALATGPDRKAPAQFRIWQAGENMTDFGPSIFSERSARDVMAEYQRRGNKLSFDYEHLSVPENRKSDEPWRGAGYFEIEVRKSGAGPELWAVRIEWSDEARRQIEQGERRYFSPDYFQDEKTGEIVRLNKIALCTDPATHRLNLLASRGNKRTTVDGEDEKDKGENKTAGEGGDPKSNTLALLLELLETATDEQKPKIRAAILALGNQDEPAVPAQMAEPQQDEPQPGQAARKAAAPQRGGAVLDASLERRFAALERRLDTDANTRLIEANRDLIPEASPALELWALKQSPENLGTWIRAQRATKPKPAGAGGHQEQQRKPAPGTGDGGEGDFDPKTIQLTAADRQILKRTGGNAVEFLNHKRLLAARKVGSDWTPEKANN